MGVFKIRETFTNGKSHSLKIPAIDEATAQTIGTTLLGGKIEVLEAPANITVTAPAVAVVEYARFDIVGKDTSTGNKTYFSFLGKSTVSDLDVRTFFLNKTINGVHIDDVTVSVKVYA